MRTGKERASEQRDGLEQAQEEKDGLWGSCCWMQGSVWARKARDGRQVRSTPSADPLSRGADHSASGEPGLSVSMGTKLMTFRLGQFPCHWVTSMTNMHDHCRCHTCQLRT